MYDIISMISLTSTIFVLLTNVCSKSYIFLGFIFKRSGTDGYGYLDGIAELFREEPKDLEDN